MPGGEASSFDRLTKTPASLSVPRLATEAASPHTTSRGDITLRSRTYHTEGDSSPSDSLEACAWGECSCLIPGIRNRGRSESTSIS